MASVTTPVHPTVDRAVANAVNAAPVAAALTHSQPIEIRSTVTMRVQRPRQLAPGIYAPVPTFFAAPTEELDLVSLQKHVVRLAAAGVGPIVAGSNGEAAHLAPGERASLVGAARAALDQAGFTATSVIAGAGAGSTFQTIRNCHEAAEAGADYVLVLTDSFYAATLRADAASVTQFYLDVASASPVPILVYSYPSVSGIEITSDQLLRLAEHPNIVGAKLTCANVGKLQRVAAVTAQPAFVASGRHGFFLFGGYADFLIPSLIARSSGAITGLANICPRVCRRLFDMGVQSITTCDAADLRAAQALQDVVSSADAVLAAPGIAATKFLLAQHYGYGGLPRKPLQPFTDHAAIVKLEAGMKEILAMERALS